MKSLMFSGEQIKLARERMGLSQARLAQMVNVSQPAIQNIESGKTTKSKHLPDVLAALGLVGQPKSAERVKSVPVYGVARAGHWIDFDDSRQEAFDEIPIVPGAWASYRQFSYKVGGLSMVKAGFHDGDYVVCVPYWEARTDVVDKDIVLVERRSGHLRETTLKRLRVSRTELKLVAESDDPAFKEPLFVQSMSPGAPAVDDGVTIEIIGLAIGRYTPIHVEEP